MFSERTRRIRRLLVGLTAAGLLLSLPATGFAAERENRSSELASAGVLARGAGYGTEAGSKAVRELQLRLRRVGDRPGPIDGLYGPMTEAAVERFQRSRGLAIDGVVGPQTKGRLLAQRAEQRSALKPSPTQTGKPERKSPARDHRAEIAPRQQPVQPSAGAGLGALFATRAAPDDGDRTTADSGALLAARDSAGAVVGTSSKTSSAAARTSGPPPAAAAPPRARPAPPAPPPPVEVAAGVPSRRARAASCRRPARGSSD